MWLLPMNIAGKLQQYPHYIGLVDIDAHSYCDETETDLNTEMLAACDRT